MFTKLFVPFDDSALSACALPYATFLAKASRGHLFLVHALTSNGYPILARTRLEAVAERLRALGIEVDIDVTPPSMGTPAQVIVEMARILETHAIVMATHRRHALRRGLFGSVADEVLRHAAVPSVSSHLAVRACGDRSGPSASLFPSTAPRSRKRCSASWTNFVKLR